MLRARMHYFQRNALPDTEQHVCKCATFQYGKTYLTLAANQCRSHLQKQKWWKQRKRYPIHKTQRGDLESNQADAVNSLFHKLSTPTGLQSLAAIVKNISPP